MKWILGAVATVLLLAVGIVLAPADARDAGPEPLRFGQDACARCRMHLSRPGFGGELRDQHGTLTRYDDLGCLLVSMWAQHAEVPGAWVEDHLSGRLLPLLEASFVVDAAEPTPMGYAILAFGSGEEATRFAEQRGGRLATLEQMLKDSARFRRAHAHQSAPGD